VSATTKLIWRARNSLGPTGRRRVRAITDVGLRPVGSVKGFGAVGPKFALTFDDGPDPVWTPPLLELLAEHQLKATFFLLTNRTGKHPGLVRRIVEAGHEIALHGDDHTRLTTLPVREVSRRIRSSKAELEDTAGASVRLFRPPFGAQSPAIYGVTRLAGLDVVVWGPQAEDWTDGSPEEVAGRALGKVRGGDILLLHDGLAVPAGETMPTFDRTAMFRILLEGLIADGLQPSMVGNLVREGATVRSAWFRP
jgi:peptidoglycan/xylan/chitin deacetylase (PgdA/CDA1 family)